jgi:hypothetical protein
VGAVSDASAAWAAAIAAVGASAITGSIAYLVMRRQVTAEDRRWYANQEVVRRAATADRLREIYAKIALAAATLQSVIGERSHVLEGETVEQRDDRHDRMVIAALNTVSTVGGQILIEDSAAEVRETYQTPVSVVQQHFSAEANQPAGNERAELLKALIDAILGLTEKLLELCRQHLAGLERPVRVDEVAGHTTRQRFRLRRSPGPAG